MSISRERSLGLVFWACWAGKKENRSGVGYNGVELGNFERVGVIVVENEGGFGHF